MGGTKDIMFPVHNRRQKVINRGLDIVKIDKTPLIYDDSYFNLGELGALFGGISPPTEAD